MGIIYYPENQVPPSLLDLSRVATVPFACSLLVCVNNKTCAELRLCVLAFDNVLYAIIIAINIHLFFF